MINTVAVKGIYNRRILAKRTRERNGNESISPSNVVGLIRSIQRRYNFTLKNFEDFAWGKWTCTRVSRVSHGGRIAIPGRESGNRGTISS